MKPQRQPYHDNYLSMYSTWFGGLTTDPLAMVLPIDDHMVHRGDGVFETFKCVNGCIYNLGAHVDRLEQSARFLKLPLPASRAALTARVVETVRAGGARDCAVRLLVSRGPGSLGVNPYDCPAPQVYIICSRLGAPFMKLHPEGATAATSRVPVKDARVAEIKSCNYLNNVLMKREAVDAGVDFVFSFREDGVLLEGATENVGIVSADRALLFPREDGVLPGTTMHRVLALAEALVADGTLTRVALADIRRPDILAAPEMLTVGTTINVVAVRTFDGRPVGTGRPGPVWARLNAMLERDILENRALQTPAWD